MAATKKNNIPADKLLLYEKLVATIPEVELKGASMPYTSCNGHMFSFLDPEGRLGLRLPDAEREAFLAEHNTRLCEAHGAVLKEYALVPDELFKKTNEIAKYFATSYAYVRSLKPKSTKK